MKEFKVLGFSPTKSTDEVERLLQEQADEGFEWVGCISFGPVARVVLQRDKPGDEDTVDLDAEARRGARIVTYAKGGIEGQQVGVAKPVDPL